MQPPTHLLVFSLMCPGTHCPVFLVLWVPLAPSLGEWHCCSSLPRGPWRHPPHQSHPNVSLHCQSSVPCLLTRHLPLPCRGFHTAQLPPGAPVFPGGQGCLLCFPHSHGPAQLWGIKFTDLHLVSFSPRTNNSFSCSASSKPRPKLSGPRVGKRLTSIQVIFFQGSF